MKRRSKVSGGRAKVQRPEVSKLKRALKPHKASRAASSTSHEQGEVARLNRELHEAHEQQIATSEVLQVISSSPGDLEPVFATMLENIVRVCDATFGSVYRCHGDLFEFVAAHSSPPAYAQLVRRSPFRPGPHHYLGQMIATKSVDQVTDLAAAKGYIERRAEFVAAVGPGGVRTCLHVPMLKDNELIGAFALARQEVRPFSEKQIALVRSFAAQAVIAIENARLLNELRQRTTDLTEALEQQTAASEVLQVISSFHGDLEPVFATILEKAVRICDASFGLLYRWNGEAFSLLAMHNTPPAFVEYRRRSPHFAPDPGSAFGRIVATKTTIHVADAMVLEGYVERSNPALVAAVELARIRTFLFVPMLKVDELLGIFTIFRQEVRPFTERQIALVTNFAAQAVIAIENARLLNELRYSLEQQTATSEVLGVISRSRFELQPVLQSVVDTAARLCRAKTSGIFRLEGGGYRLAAASGLFDPAYFEIEQQALISPGPGTLVGRAAMNRQVVQIEDAWSDPLYEEKENAKLGGVRSMIGVPLMREGEPIGVLGLARTQAEPFVDREVELVRTFADQAVIAIENARLLNELRERTDQLAAQQELSQLNQHLEQRVTDQVDEIERMSRLRRFLPPQVADLIVASGTEKQLESHRREITALFCDLRGFTGFTESADAEDVMALLRDYHAAIGEIIIKYNGTLERDAGDGVMVVFNDPVPVENPALQAVLMALEVRDAIGALTATWSRLGHEIGFGIGIAHGFATLGTIGFEGRFDYAAIGTVSNVASRLCDEAKPGQILISPRVLMKVENAVSVEPVGEFELKGIRRPLAAYNVVGGGPRNT